jgi:hypothetical protein
LCVCVCVRQMYPIFQVSVLVTARFIILDRVLPRKGKDEVVTQWKYQQDAACNRIYYSKVYRRLNMFRAAHRSSSGALNCICSLWFIYPCGDRLFSSLDNGLLPLGYMNQRLQIQFRSPDDERCAARNMLNL